MATARPIPRWTVVTKANCIWCDRVKKLLAEHNKLVTYVDLDLAPGVANLLLLADLKTVPQVFEERYWIGGYDSTKAYLENLGGEEDK